MPHDLSTCPSQGQAVDARFRENDEKAGITYADSGSECCPWASAFERVKELAARPVTSPRLRGEVRTRASARGFRVRGNGVSPIAKPCAISKRPLTSTLSPQAGPGRNLR